MSLHDEIKEKARKALEAFIKSGMSSKEALQKVQNTYVDDVIAVMSTHINDLKIGTITPYKLRKMAIGSIDLSTKLYSHIEDVNANVLKEINLHAKDLQNAQILARKIYEGYDFQKDLIEVKKSIPKYLFDPLNKISSKQLKTPALKAAYLKILNSANEKQLQAALETAMYERNRYFANRIAQTELHRVRTAAKVKGILEDEGIEVIQIRLSATHPKVDICDYHANLDAYGLGKGCYPKDKAPLPPYHPFCRCMSAPRIDLSLKDAKAVNGDPEKTLMRQFDEVDQVNILGTKGMRDKWLQGEGVIDLVDRVKKPLYRTKYSGELPKALVPDLNGDELLTLKIRTPDNIPSMLINNISRELGVAYSISRTGWDDSRHDSFINGDVDAVKNHPNYETAKSGSFEDSIVLSKSFLNVDRIAKKYNNPIILPIMAEEKQGKNAIPLGMMEAIQEKTGWIASDGIYQNNKAGHTGSNGWYRLASHATFEGEVVKGANYLIVDDFIGMGGTLASLKSFIENAGANVVGYEVLTGKPESYILYLRKNTLNLLREKHGEFEKEFESMLGFDYSGLTESEANYLLRAKSIERIRNQLIKAISQREGSSIK